MPSQTSLVEDHKNELQNKSGNSDIILENGTAASDGLFYEDVLTRKQSLVPS